MADVRKTVVLTSGEDVEPSEQDWKDTNNEVFQLFQNKSDLKQVTLTFDESGEFASKTYERL